MLRFFTQDYDEVFALSFILVFIEQTGTFLEAPMLIGDEYLHVPPIDLRLYNHTGNCVTGFHYDPVFLRRVHPCGITRGAKKQTKEGIGIAALGAASRPCTSKLKRNLRSSARAATSLQEPSYLQRKTNSISDTCFYC